MGLGLPLFAAAAERTGGSLAVQSQPGLGTTVEAVLALDHPDRQPLGDMAGTLMVFLLAESAPDLHYVHRLILPLGDRERASEAAEIGPAFEFDTTDIREALGDIALNNATVRRWLAEFLAEGEAEMRHFEDMGRLEHA